MSERRNKTGGLSFELSVGALLAKRDELMKAEGYRFLLPRDVYPEQVDFRHIRLKSDLDREVCVAATTLYEGECPVCNGSGMYRLKPPAPGQPVPEDGWGRCPCVDLKERMARVSAIGIPSDLDLASWPDTQDDMWAEGTDWRRKIFGYLKGWDRTRKGLYFYGPTGTGKTHIVTLIAYSLAAKGASVKWVDWKTVSPELKKSFKRGETVRDFYEKHIKRPDLVIFDDLGRGPSVRDMPWMEEVYEELLGRRASSRKCMVISSNLSPEQLADHINSSRVTSRVARVVDSVPVHNNNLRGDGAGFFGSEGGFFDG